jgi:ribosomal protein S27AE
MKKDPNYVAAVEKAIAEKYGTETVQDFRSAWGEDKEKEYLRQLKEARQTKHKKKINEETNTSFYRIKKTKKIKKTERLCPVCKTYSFSMKDDLYMNRFKCCFACYIDFVEGSEDRWKQGHRPDQERIEAALLRRRK